MQTDTVRTRAMEDTRKRILDVALEVLGRNPEAGMADIAAAAGVVRRTVYGYFPTRADLVQTLARQAVDEIASVLDAIKALGTAPEMVWVDFIGQLWPVAHRYRVLLALRRGEYGAEIHAVLRPVDQALAELVQEGQDIGVFGRHLPAAVLSQVAFAAVFALADSSLSGSSVSSQAASITSLLMLGVPDARARVLTEASNGES